MSKEFSSDDVFSGLSAETIKALREFALQSGVAIVGDDPTNDTSNDLSDPKALVKSVQNHFHVQDREEIFHIDYESDDKARHVVFDVKGVKRELGQTLNSTGLTIWRAAEHMCKYLINHPDVISNKSICELGAGLGLVSILVEKLDLPILSLIVTDGDEDTLSLLIENKIENECTFETAYLYWGEHDDFLSDHEEKFDLLLAADVIYEEEQVEPLFETVHGLLKESGEFILAYARRNVWIDKVLSVAEQHNLQWKVISTLDYETEPIYSFTFKR